MERFITNIYDWVVITYLFTLTLSIRDSIFPGLQTDSPSFIDMLIGVATIEEIAKIIPVVIIIKITKSINEPIDEQKKRASGICKRKRKKN